MSYEVLYARPDQSYETDSFGQNRSKQLTLWQENKIPGVMCRNTEFKGGLHMNHYPHKTLDVLRITLSDRYT